MESVVDKFDRANDPTGLGSDYLVELGNLQVVDEGAIQQAGAGFAETARATHLTALDTEHQRVAAWAEIMGVTGSPYAEVFARFREKPNISPADTNTGYAVRLTRTANADTLSIQKYDGGTPTQKASVEVTLGSPAGMVPIQIGVQDIDGVPEITAFLSDLENPLLVWQDTQHPVWQQIGLVGFSTFEGSGETVPQVVIHTFEAAVLVVTHEDLKADEPLAWNAEKIVTHIRFNVDRNGPLSHLEFDDVLDFLNLVESQFVNDVGPVDWLKRNILITAPAGARFVNMPARVSDEIIDIYDETNNVMLAHREQHDMNVRVPNRDQSSGPPQTWSNVGRSSAGRVRVELWPIPAGVTQLTVLARAVPGLMTAEDYPLVPLDMVDALVQGVIVKSGAATGNEKLMRISSATYNRWVKRARAKDRRSRDIHIVPARSLPQRHRPPLSRHQMRRFPFL